MGFLLVFIAISISAIAIASSNQSSTSGSIDIRGLFKAYDSNTQSFYTLVENGTLKKARVVYFDLDPFQFPHSDLKIDSEDPYSLWINNRLSGQHLSVGFSLDSLKDVYGSKLLFALHADERIIAKLQIKIQPSSKDLGFMSNEESGAPAIVQPGYHRFLATGFALFIVLLGLHNLSFPKVFREYFNPAAVLFPRISIDSLITARQFNPGTLMALIIHSYLMMFIFLGMVNWFHDVPLIFEYFQSNDYWFLMACFGVGGISVLVVLILKYLFLNVIGFLFGIQNFSPTHFFDFIRISAIIYIVLAIWLMINFFTFNQSIGEGHIYGILGLLTFAIIRILIILGKLMNSFKLQFSYLFSYICTTEIIPLAIVVKLFFRV
jgi:hypothetical protein